MQLEDYFDFIDAEANNIWTSRAIRLKGHRVGIEHVLAHYREGYTPDEIVNEFPGVSLEKIYAALTFYLHYQTEVNAYLERVQANRDQDYAAWVAQSQTMPVVQRLRETRSQYISEPSS